MGCGHLRQFALIALACAMGIAVARANPIGNAFTVVQEVKGLLDKEVRVLVVNDDVHQDEAVVTGPRSATKLVFKDNTNLTMGENSKLKLTKVVFDPDPSKSAVIMKATQGVFRMSTGTLPHSAYRIETPVATIGVRGTVIEIGIGGDGATTLYVAQGAATVTVTTPAGSNQVLVPLGMATTVTVGANGQPNPPTAPGQPSSQFVQDMRHMTALIQLAGTEGGGTTGATAVGSAAQVFGNVQVSLSTAAETGGGLSSGPSPGVPSGLMAPVTTSFPGIGAPSPLILPSAPAGTAAFIPPPSLPPAPPPCTTTVPQQTRIGTSTPIALTCNNATPGAGQGAVSGSATTGYDVTATDHGTQQGTIPVVTPDGTGQVVVTTQGVGPNVETDLPVNGLDFVNVPLGGTESLHFHIGNFTNDPPSLALQDVGLCILGLNIVGADSALYSLTFDPSGLPTCNGLAALAPGDTLDVTVTFNAPLDAGVYNDAVLQILTDQFAVFGSPGLELDFPLSASVDPPNPIPEPGGIVLCVALLGFGVVMARRREA